MSETYYKITVNGTESDETQDYDDISTRWSNIAGILEGRGGHAVLSSRSVHGLDIMPLLSNPENWIIVDNVAISPWNVIAKIDY